MSDSIIKELTADEIESLQYEHLEALMLHHLVYMKLSTMTELLHDLGIDESHEFKLSGPLRDSRQRLKVAINRLFDKRLVSGNAVGGNQDEIVPTPEGEQTLKIEDFGYRSESLVRVSRRVLHVELLQSRLSFLLGEYEDAMSKSLESIETRVRRLSNPRKSDLGGAKLMRHAFGKKGVLSRASQVMPRAVVDLLVGATEVNPNILTYGQRDDKQFVNSVTEVIQFANLLHHYLDKYDRRDSRIIAPLPTQRT